MLMSAGRSILLVIDIQDKLYPACAGSEQMMARTAFLLKCAERLDVPVVVTEQYPAGLGKTAAMIADAYPDDVSVVSKMSFSCCGEAKFLDELDKHRARDQVVVAGMETHVCVLQSVIDLMAHDKQVYVAADAVASRTEENKQLGLTRMARDGAHIVSSESVMFEWLRVAGTDAFKDLVQLIK